MATCTYAGHTIDGERMASAVAAISAWASRESGGAFHSEPVRSDGYETTYEDVMAVCHMANGWFFKHRE